MVPATEDGPPAGCPHTHELFRATGEEAEVPRGLPRPLYAGWPVPYNVPTSQRQTGRVPQFRNHDDARQAEAADDDLCMVCGESLRAVARVVVVLDADEGYVIDDVAMHERCASLSLAWCPWLREPEQRILVRSLSRRVWRRLRAEMRASIGGIDGRRHGRPFGPEREVPATAGKSADAGDPMDAPDA